MIAASIKKQALAAGVVSNGAPASVSYVSGQEMTGEWDAQEYRKRIIEEYLEQQGKEQGSST